MEFEMFNDWEFVTQEQWDMIQGRKEYAIDNIQYLENELENFFDTKLQKTRSRTRRLFKNLKEELKEEKETLDRMTALELDYKDGLELVLEEITAFGIVVPDYDLSRDIDKLQRMATDAWFAFRKGERVMYMERQGEMHRTYIRNNSPAKRTCFRRG